MDEREASAIVEQAIADNFMEIMKMLEKKQLSPYMVILIAEMMKRTADKMIDESEEL